MAINLIVDNTNDGGIVEPGSRLDYALKYAAIGWHVFPTHSIIDGVCSCGDTSCKNAGKHPLSELVPFGQSQATTDKTQIKKWFERKPQANIAVLLSKSNLCAIDIDPRNGGHYTIEQIEQQQGELLSDVLAYTGGGGEHRVFELPQGMQLPGKLGKGIDVKVNGYIIVEPSNHASGGAYEWEASSNPLDGAIPSPLPDWLRDLTRPVHIVDDAVASTAVEITEDQLSEIRNALTYIDADDRQVWTDIGMALQAAVGGSLGYDLWCEWSSKSVKFDASDQLRVWRSFKSRGLAGITKNTLFDYAYKSGWAGWVSATAEAVFEVPVVEKIKTQSIQRGSKLYNPPCPERLPVKLLADVADYFSGLTDKPTPAISIAGAIALGSVLTGRIYKSEADNYTSLLMAVSGPSGIGKNYIKVGIERILLRADFENLIAGNFYTHQTAIYSALKEAPTHICVSDEFGENFMEARKNNNSNKLTVFKALKQVFSDAHHIFKADSFSKIGKGKDIDTSPIKLPSLTLLGLTTPLQFYSEIKIQHIESGLINRFLIINTDMSERIETVKGSSEPSLELIDSIQNIRSDIIKDICNGSIEPEQFLVSFTNEARAIFKKAQIDQDYVVSTLLGDHLDAMPQRWREIAMRMATMFAAMDNPSSPAVSGVMAQWAVDYVFHHGVKTLDVIRSSASENDYQGCSNLVAEYIRVTPGCSDQDLSRKFRSIKRKERVDIMQHLLDAGLVRMEKQETTGRYKNAWFFCGDE